MCVWSRERLRGACLLQGEAKTISERRNRLVRGGKGFANRLWSYGDEKMMNRSTVNKRVHKCTKELIESGATTIDVVVALAITCGVYCSESAILEETAINELKRASRTDYNAISRFLRRVFG